MNFILAGLACIVAGCTYFAACKLAPAPGAWWCLPEAQALYVLFGALIGGWLLVHKGLRSRRRGR